MIFLIIYLNKSTFTRDILPLGITAISLTYCLIQIYSKNENSTIREKSPISSAFASNITKSIETKEVHSLYEPISFANYLRSLSPIIAENKYVNPIKSYFYNFMTMIIDH